ncbi:sigma-70 family RNA polymerase sigma factor [Vaginisenegalia massiliensis]|uniref:sigma-70 family RNA polymerase sigma factor n=1 Tax=Vaginisenegalia massiliensis TaxID=2058294 RepID=UPI000F542BBF|nr:sigma-70 family RNA polymerase sigma factor [Vaginisenegalia massiliensis]
MENNQFVSTEEAIIQQYRPLVWSCLRKAGIDMKRFDYDDYLQIGLLALVQAARTSQTDPLVPPYYQFLAYARRQIMWKLRDQQRRSIPHEQAEQLAESIPEYGDDGGLQRLEDTLVDQDLIRFLLSKLAAEDRTFLAFLMLHGEEKIACQAQLLGISRKTFYQRRAKLAKRIRPLLEQWG